jgi:PAS domain S-box-containing protein
MTETQLKTLIYTIPDSVWLKDAEGKYITCNAMFEKASGHKEKELAGKTDYDFYDKETADFFSNSDHDVLTSKKRVRYEHKSIIKETGQALFVDTIKTPLFDKEQNVVGVLGIAHDITLQKEMEEALRTSETHLKALIHTIPDSVWLKDKKGEFIWCNAAFEEMNGLTEADIIGKTDNDLSPKELADFFAGTDRQVLKTRKAVQFENQSFSKKTGTTIVLETIKAPLLDSEGKVSGILGIARDITERKLAKERLSDERTLLRTIIDMIPDAIYVKDKQGRKILANPKEVSISGKNSEEEVLGKTDNELYTERTAIRFQEEDNKIMKTGKSLFNYESQLVDNKGKKHWLQGFKAPLVNTKNEIVGIVGLNHDVTEQKLAEIEIQKRNEELAKINAEKDKFFSIIAHDLRGPFGNFLSLTEMMTEEFKDLSPEQLREMVTALKTSSAKLYGLLENLLQWSRSQRNMMKFEPEITQLSFLVNKSIKPLIDSATKKEIKVEMSIPENVTIYADNHLMETVIRNLFSNAIKFTPKNGKITISATHRKNNWLEVAVSDSGIGMSNELAENLFKLDKETGRKGTEGEPSSGLGLLLCKEFVEKNGGVLRVESKEGAGSTFYFTTPTNPNPALVKN